MPKVTRAKIRQGLDSVPMETLILGVNHGQERTLTPKQKAFARAVALGESKASAYRGAYNSKTRIAKTQGDAGSRLASHPGVAAEVAAVQLALQAQEYQTPAKLRALVIHQLTIHAMDTSIAPAQRIKALQLLGTVSEVAAFTERKEVTTVQASVDVRARLLSTLSDVIKSQAIDITPNETDATSLLAEIAQAKAPDSALAEPTHPPPASCAPARPCARSHTNSLKGSSDEIQDVNISEEISEENISGEIMPIEEEVSTSLVEEGPPGEFVGKVVGGVISEEESLSREGKDWRPAIVDGERRKGERDE